VPTGYFPSRWHAGVPTPALFWQDMLLTGSLVNLAASVFALILAAKTGLMALAVLLHFAPLPFNAFLFAAFWRRRDRSPLTSALACVWLLLACLL
jgi:uncharacterized membrane protein